MHGREEEEEGDEDLDEDEGGPLSWWALKSPVNRHLRRGTPS